jgi:hypothetical protein
MNTKKLSLAFSLFVVTVFSQTSFAQGLNWEGQTGALLTPFAYTASSPSGTFGKPEVGFHYLNGGNVIGNDYQLHITEGVGKHFEIGYTAALSSSGNVGPTGSGNYPPSYLFSNGFNEFHGKLNFVNENAWKTKWVPAIAVGAIGRTGIQRVGSVGLAHGASANNADFYVVATKTVTQVKGLPFVLSLGDKVTNASVFGIAGNAQNWQGRLFGAAAVVLKGPAKSTLIAGSEAVQQPHYVEGLPRAATVPTSLSYFVRIVPHLEGTPLQVDLAIVQAAGKIVNIPGNAVDLNARARFGIGISYHL